MSLEKDNLPGADRMAHALEIEALRQITNNLERINRKMDDQGNKMDDLNLRLDRIENSRLGKDVEALRAALVENDDRLSDLEAAALRRDGAVGVAQIVLKSPALGWLAGTAAAVWAVLSGKGAI